jgi:membrane associated rhomboid family serine protease
MGIYDRDYYRREGPTFLGSLNDGGKVCIWLIAANVILYILQLVTMQTPNDPFEMMIGRASSPVTEWLEIDTTKILHGQVWRLVTGAFLHSPHNFLHIFFNMLFLWWFGHELENIYGGKEFLAFYFAAAVISSLAYVGWQLVDGSRTPAVGASGAVTAVLLVFAMHYPHHKIIMWFFPISIWLFVAFEVGKDLYAFLSGNHGGVGVTAHLGGAAFGFLYYKQQWRVLNFIPDFSSRGRARARPRLRIYHGDDAPTATVSAPVPSEPPIDEQLEAQVDAVLEKMARSGKESLTESEKELLLKASELYKRRRT